MRVLIGFSSEGRMIDIGLLASIVADGLTIENAPAAAQWVRPILGGLWKLDALERFVITNAPTDAVRTFRSGLFL